MKVLSQQVSSFWNAAVLAFIQTPISILTINLHSPLWRKATAESPACSLLSCPCAFHSVCFLFFLIAWQSRSLSIPAVSSLDLCSVNPLAAADRPETELCPSKPAVIASTVTASPLSSLQRWQFRSVWLIEQARFIFVFVCYSQEPDESTLSLLFITLCWPGKHLHKALACFVCIKMKTSCFCHYCSRVSSWETCQEFLYFTCKQTGFSYLEWYSSGGLLKIPEITAFLGWEMCLMCCGLR